MVVVVVHAEWGEESGGGRGGRASPEPSPTGRSVGRNSRGLEANAVGVAMAGCERPTC